MGRCWPSRPRPASGCGRAGTRPRKARDRAVGEKAFVRGLVLRGHLAVIGGLLIAPGYGLSLQALDPATGAVVYRYEAKEGGEGMTIGLRLENLLVSRSESDNDGRYGVWIPGAPRAEAFKRWSSIQHYHYCYESVALPAYGDGFLYVRSLEKGGCIQGWERDFLLMVIGLAPLNGTGAVKLFQ